MAHTTDPRPLSPHLTIWRWHITMATSIAHRASGVALYVGATVLTVWLVSIAAGPDAFEAVNGLLLSLLGRAVLFAFTLAATFHLANGVRHLVWDTGAGFGLGTANAASWFIFAFCLIATGAIWAAAYWL